MTSFVLVHGSGQNAESWSRVGALLESRGHSIAAPELPKTAADWGLEEHAAKIAASVESPDTVIVAHSLCGVFLPVVATLRTCARMVFVAAVIPEPGKSLRDLFTEDAAMFNPDWIAAGQRWFDESQQEGIAREFLFHDCDDETLAWALGTIELIDSAKAITQSAPYAEWPTVPAASIVASDDLTLTPDWCRRRSIERLGHEAIEVEAWHCPHMSRPDDVADILDRLAVTGD